MRRFLVIMVVAVMMVSSVFYAPALTNRSGNVSSTAPPENLTMADFIESQPALDLLPLLTERSSQPAYAQGIGGPVMFLEWLFGAVTNRMPVEQRHADGRTVVAIYPPPQFCPALGLRPGGFITRGPYDLDSSIRLVKSADNVKNQWRAQFQFQFLMLKKELRTINLFQNGQRCKEVEKEWNQTHRYMAWHTPSDQPADLYDALIDFGGTLHSHAAISVTTKTISEWLADFSYEKHLGKWMASRPYCDDPARLNGVLVHIKANGLPPGIKVKIFDMLLGHPTLALDGEELSWNEDTAVFVRQGDPIFLVVNASSGLTMTPANNVTTTYNQMAYKPDPGVKDVTFTLSPNGQEIRGASK